MELQVGRKYKATKPQWWTRNPLSDELPIFFIRSIDNGTVYYSYCNAGGRSTFDKKIVLFLACAPVPLTPLMEELL